MFFRTSIYIYNYKYIHRYIDTHIHMIYTFISVAGYVNIIHVDSVMHTLATMMRMKHEIFIRRVFKKFGKISNDHERSRTVDTH